MTDPRPGDELPFDSDVEVDDVGAVATGGPARPVHLRPGFLLLVGVGGATGTLARYLLQQAVEPWNGVPVITVGINLLGAFLLGLLLESLARRGEDHGTRRILRLLLGTGVLGGFTTYSALSVDTLTLLQSGEVGLAALYALGTLLLGAVASTLGVIAGAAAHRRQDARRATTGVGGGRS